VVIIFDLDGTLLDTYELIKASFIHTFQKHLPEYQYTDEELDSFFGPLLDESFAKLTKDEKQISEMIKTYREFNLSMHHKYVKTFPYAKEVLEKLYNENYKLAVLSNKRRDAVLLGLDITGLTKYFNIILGSNDVTQVKPHPEGIFKVLEHFQTSQAVMVGDTAYDMQAAQNAGIVGIGVSWANTSVEQLQKSGAHYIAHDYLELYEMIKGVNRNV